MALESEPQSTPLGGSNLDALKSESNVDLEDGEIDDDDDDETPEVLPGPAPSTPAAASSTSGSSVRVPQLPKNLDSGRRDQHDNVSPPWIQRRASNKLPSLPKLKKNSKNLWNHPHKKSFPNDEDDEDDFAVTLEKALQEKAKQAVKEKSAEEREPGDSDDHDDHWTRKKKKRKKGRDDGGEHEPKAKKKHLEGDEGEEDMIFVRGASPHQRLTTSPYRDFDRSFESFGEDEEDFDGSPERGGHGGYGLRGRGRGNKVVRGRGRGGRVGAPMRGSKRGNHRGLSGKSQRMGRDRQELCMYFMQGKCPKDADECPYSHEGVPRRKMELCKFYNMNCCAKREKCLYMHKDFPCKFFHTGRRCDSGDNCRFSHDKLTDNTRNVLLKHIELAPKEILGEFRRLTREQANQIIDRAARLRSEGKNPEELDLLRLHDDGDYETGEERAHTPMPSSPGEVVQNESEYMRSRSDEGKKRDYHDHDHNRGRDRNRDRSHNFGSDRREHSEKREHRERKRKRRWDNPDDSHSQLFKLQESLQRKLREQETEEKNSENKKASKQSETTEDNVIMNKDLSYENSSISRVKTPTSSFSSSFLIDEHDDSTNAKNSREAVGNSLKTETPHGESSALGEGQAVESGEESQDSSGIIPSHLPKRQRELFLRIQQQQREADHNLDSKANESEDENPAEDNWYSSDEDGPTSLTDVLKNLKEGQQSDKEVKKPKEVPNNVEDSKEKGDPSQPSEDCEEFKSDHPKETLVNTGRRPPLLPTPTILTNLMKNTAIDQLLSTIRYASPVQGNPGPNTVLSTTLQSTVQPESLCTPVGLQSPGSISAVSATVPVRDPRLSRDPRSRTSGVSTNNTSPSASPSSIPSDTRQDPRLERIDPRSERRDPRIELRHDTGQCLSDSLMSPRSDQRSDSRHSDLQAARPETRRSSEGSTSSTGSNPLLSTSNQRSIYDNSSPPILCGAGDVDLRIRNVAPDAAGDTDFRTQLGAGDMDMRRNPPSSGLPGSSAFPVHDTDLRFRMNLSSMELEGNYSRAAHSDMDLRRMQMMLPFKPAPVHTPATEINAHLSSHTPGPYHVVCIDIPKPDFSTLKINPRDPQAKLDPRVRRIFGLNQSDPQTSSTPLSPPSETPPQTSLTSPSAIPADPRRRGSASRPADPRQSRTGGASASCPQTPRVDDYDDPIMSDTDLRMQSMYGRPHNQWDNFSNRGRGLLPHPDQTWGSPVSSTHGQRLPQVQAHLYQQHQPFSPSPK